MQGGTPYQLQLLVSLFSVSVSHHFSSASAICSIGKVAHSGMQGVILAINAAAAVQGKRAKLGTRTSASGSPVLPQTMPLPFRHPATRH